MPPQAKQNYRALVSNLQGCALGVRWRPIGKKKESAGGAYVHASIDTTCGGNAKAFETRCHVGEKTYSLAVPSVTAAVAWPV